MELIGISNEMETTSPGQSVVQKTERSSSSSSSSSARPVPTQTDPPKPQEETFGQEPNRHLVINIGRSNSSSARPVPTQTDPPKPQEETFVQFGLWVSGVTFATLCGLLASKFGEEKGLHYVLFMLCVLVLLTVLILGIVILVLAYVPFTNWLDRAAKFKILELLRSIDLGLICLFIVVGFSSLLFLKRHIK